MFKDRWLRLSKLQVNDIVKNCNVMQAMCVLNKSISDAEEYAARFNTQPVQDLDIEPKRSVNNLNKRSNTTFKPVSVFSGKKPSNRSKSLKSIPQWWPLRTSVIGKYGKQCMCCGLFVSDKYVHVDHIKPRSIYPELTLCFDNLQVLCMECNFTKGLLETDFRRIPS